MIEKRTSASAEYMKLQEFENNLARTKDLFAQFDRIERLLKWLVIQRINDDVWVMKSHPLKDARGKPIPIKEEQWQKSPDISDIIEEKE